MKPFTILPTLASCERHIRNEFASERCKTLERRFHKKVRSTQQWDAGYRK